ncbi:MAG: Sec-independent protein translocase protein TatB [Campylobacterota bacterium]|nr:Sec-independent protein translocase protein TatB [Campylobacterota bacterium]
MFGMGFTEILIIAVIAILFMGPDKLPGAMVEIAKFFRTVKKTVGSVKDSLEEEMHVSEIKQEALAYKKELLDASDKLNKATDIKGAVASGLSDLNDDILGDDNLETETPKDVPKAAPKPEKVTFEKKSKKPKKEENIDV